MNAKAANEFRHHRHIRTGFWFACVVAAILAVWFGGNELFYRWAIAPRKYPPLAPGVVSLLGLKLNGYRIIVSNGIARMQEGGDEAFSKPEDISSETAGAVVPMKGLVTAMQGQPEGIAELVGSLAGIKREIEPRKEIIWKAEDIARALAGDKTLRQKLEDAICVRLDGSPADRVSWQELQEGIWIRLRVPLKIASPSGIKEVAGIVEIPYQSRIGLAVAKRIQVYIETRKKLAPDAPTIAGFYREVSKALPKENVAQSLKGLISARYVRQLAQPAENLLSGVTVLLTEKQITGAEVAKISKPQGDGFLYNIALSITTEARDRLWQFTHENAKAQLLLVSNGVAIAAPFVSQEMKYSKVTITNIADEDLANEALALIKGQAGK